MVTITFPNEIFHHIDDEPKIPVLLTPILYLFIVLRYALLLFINLFCLDLNTVQFLQQHNSNKFLYNEKTSRNAMS